MWAELMRRLGYDRYGTQGGDLGAYVAPEVAKVAPEHVVGVHIDGGFGFPTEADVPGMTEAERAEWAQMQQWMSGGVDHHALLRAAPQTFAYGWHDSPVGLLAWLTQKFKEFAFMAETARPGDRPRPDPHQRERLLVHRHRRVVVLADVRRDCRDGGFAWPKGQKRGARPACTAAARR